MRGRWQGVLQEKDVSYIREQRVQDLSVWGSGTLTLIGCDCCRWHVYGSKQTKREKLLISPILAWKLAWTVFWMVVFVRLHDLHIGLFHYTAPFSLHFWGKLVKAAFMMRDALINLVNLNGGSCNCHKRWRCRVVFECCPSVKCCIILAELLFLTATMQTKWNLHKLERRVSK